MTKTDALKQFFGTEKHPVTTKELTELKKSDPAGFDELGNAAIDAMTLKAS